MPNYSGIWTEQAMMQAVAAGTWSRRPGAPTIGTATAGNAQATVTFTAPTDLGIGTITYTATSSPGGFTASGSASPLTVTGLTNGTAYTFTVTASTEGGTGPASAASNSVSPVDPGAFIENIFGTYLYAGNGATQTITNGIDLSTNGGLVWIKARSNADWNIFEDTARGVNQALSSNNTNTQATFANSVTSFNSTGFSLGSNGAVNDAAYSALASWTFRKKTKFFDIVTYTGDGTSNRVIPHNLGSVPGCIIVKSTNTAQDWWVYHRGIGATQYLNLNLTVSAATYAIWGDTNPTSTGFTVNYSETNGSGKTYVAYLFAHNAGGFGTSGSDNVISCGSFTTDASGQATVNLGFEPQWILTKTSSSAQSWYIQDNMRGYPVRSANSPYLVADTSAGEVNGSPCLTYPTATGFVFDQNISVFNSKTFIYIAIRRGPMALPTDATKVFSPVARSGTSAVATVTGLNFPPDAMFTQTRNINYVVNPVFDRLRGVPPFLIASQTYAEQTGDTDVFKSFNMDGVTLGNDIANNGTNRSGYNYINWFFGRAPGFFDEVCYTGTSSNQDVAHNLGVAPELIITKTRGTAGTNWWTFSGFTGSGFNRTALNLTDAASAFNYAVNAGFYSQPTATTLPLSPGVATNTSGRTYVQYLFATCAGVSKVGSYTGTGTLTTINCGFSGGARFVLIKRTDSTGNWYVWDTARGMVSGTDPSLYINDYVVEVNANSVYTATTGFQLLASPAVDVNTSGGSYIYLAIA